MCALPKELSSTRLVSYTCFDLLLFPAKAHLEFISCIKISTWHGQCRCIHTLSVMRTSSCTWTFIKTHMWSLITGLIVLGLMDSSQTLQAAFTIFRSGHPSRIGTRRVHLNYCMKSDQWSPPTIVEDETKHYVDLFIFCNWCTTC